jgi:RNA polymerase sigma factor (sigma-70 family)
MGEYSFIWERFKKGDEVAFKNLYDEYFEILYRFGQRFTSDNDLLNNSIQDLFVKLWNNKSNINSTTSVKNYLFTAFRRTLVRNIESFNKKEINFHLDVEALKNTETITNDLFTTEEAIEIKNQLISMLSNITDREREIIYLKFYEDFSYEKIAEIMDISVKSTYKLLYKAFSKIRAQHSNLEIWSVYIFLYQSLKH